MTLALVTTEKLRERIKTTGMTQEALAKAIGVSRQYFNEVINHKQGVSATFITGAIRAGLGENIQDIAQIGELRPKKSAA